jgi:hypothetical protein
LTFTLRKLHKRIPSGAKRNIKGKLICCFGGEEAGKQFFIDVIFLRVKISQEATNEKYL